jgi:hypothetical protein
MNAEQEWSGILDKFKSQLVAMALLLCAIPATVDAQEMQPPSPTQNAGQVQNAPAYTQAQLDQMIAPIALYPDQLVGQILMASTYPLEVVEAERWLQDTQNASLKGDQLSAALQQQPWDPSVKSLVPFPQVLQTMDKNLQWTEQLGDAFLAQQPAVMDSVQRLRAQAQAAGTLKSTQQQAVSTEGQAIQIQPANPQVVYVPYYNPTVVYGAWPYPAYPPFYFPPPYGYAYDGAFIGFGIGLAIIEPFWGWDRWDWGHHRIDIDNDRFSHINHGRGPIASGVWQHDPAHRQGVPYHSAAVRTQYQHASEQARHSYRGYSAESAPLAGHATAKTASAEHVVTSGRVVRPNAEVHMRSAASASSAASVSHRAAQTATAQRSSASVSRRPAQAAISQRPSVPVFESLAHGSDARVHAARGASSRSAAMPSRGSAGGNVHSGGVRGGNEKHR